MPIAPEGPPTVSIPDELRAALDARLREGALELPVLPEVASQVISASFDEDCDLRSLAVLIQRDPSMTAHLLRLANSALYSPTMPIVSLQQALNRLGMKRIREIALIISCESRVFRVAGFDLAVRALFRHSLATAAFAQEIARARRWNVEEAFLCGLLHDVGRPVLLQVLADLRERQLPHVERDALLAAAGLYHCRVGADLVEKWNLPARLAETILRHHEPEAAESAAQTAMMTRLADDLAHFSLGTATVTEEQVRAHPMNVPLNVYPEEMDHLLERRKAILGIVEAIG